MSDRHGDQKLESAKKNNMALLKSSEGYRFARESNRMAALPKSRLLRFVEQAMQLAQRAIARYSTKFSKRQYTLHQHIVLLRLRFGRILSSE